jgi:hypothetical protein
MEDPVSDMSPEVRALLNRAKAEGAPDDGAVIRVRGTLLRRVGVATVTSGALITSTRAAAAVKWLPGVAKVVAGLSIMGAMAAGTRIYVERSQAVSVLHPSIPTRTLAAPKPSASVVPLPQEPPAPLAAASPAPSEQLREPVRPKRAPIPAAPQDVAPQAVPTQSVPDLGGDIERLRAAQKALAAGDAKRALAAAENVNPQGPLREEREGLRALSACAMAAPEMRQVASDFIRRFPDSPLALRVRAACLDHP